MLGTLGILLSHSLCLCPLPPPLSTPATERPSSLSEMGAGIQKGPSSHKGVCVVTSTKLKGPSASMKSSLHWSVKRASLSRLLIMELTSCNLGGEGGGNNHWIGEAVLEIPSRGVSRRPKCPGKGVHPHSSSPYGNHICTITVVATAQVKKRCDIVRGHGSPHIPCNHSDPGGRGMGGFTAGYRFPTLPFSFTRLLLGELNGGR